METKPGVIMIKARAAEIVYESLKKTLMKEGVISDNERELILIDLRGEFGVDGVTDEEIIDFVDFLRNDVNESLKKN